MSRLSRAWQRLATPLDSAVPFLGLFVVCLAFLWKLAFTNLILARGDMFLYFYPNWDYAADAIRHGHLPLWNPYLFMGVPFFANSQTGVLYPLNLALAWWPTTRAIALTIILHLWLAGAGMYIFARRSLSLSRWAAWLGAVTFALGGYLGAQVEHVNQLEALAWLPFLFVFFDLALHRGRFTLALAAITTLQLLAGHTQSVFISLVGLGLYALGPLPEAVIARQLNWRDLARRLGLWITAAVLGALLAAVQLIPTLELARQSMRAGGLTWREAVSFSLSPSMLPQTLLPNYREMMFSEYVAYIGILSLPLTVIGIWACWKRSYQISTTEFPNRASQRALSILALLGLLLAFGGYNPLYSLLVKFVPGFNLFRVPARWLVLYAFGAAALVGVGLEWLRPRWRFDIWYLKFPLAALLVIDLFLASRPLDYNQLTAPDALTDLRPSEAFLLAQDRDSRFLSISPIFFDPGDKAELASAFADQLSPESFYDLVIATKHKEIIGPNLSLYYRLFAADGYDGGVLPLRNYAIFQSLFVPSDKIAPDGRLRENLRDVPDSKWLSLMNVRYVITDKTLDAWIDDVFYDLQFTTALAPIRSSAWTGQHEASVAYVPPFEATTLGLVSYMQGATSLPDGTPVAEATLGFAGGSTQTFTLRAGVDTAEGVYTGTVSHRQARVGGHFMRDHPEYDDYVTRLRFDRPRVVTSVVVRPLLSEGQIVVRGASLIDERTGGFQSLVISGRGRFRLVQSGDVKIYENLDILPRAFMVPRATFTSGNSAIVTAMRENSFDPSRAVVLDGVQPQAEASQASGQKAGIASYTPEHIIIETESASAGWLVLTDAWYPGWRATVDGTPVEISRGDVHFRAVPIPAGQHRVEFAFVPVSLWFGASISLATLICCTLALWLARRQKTQHHLAASAGGVRPYISLLIS